MLTGAGCAISPKASSKKTKLLWMEIAVVKIIFSLLAHMGRKCRNNLQTGVAKM
ncbi:hypothetical protein GA0116948_10368 [Chitinophaga costaii]|uniref:Uncharacterized protein n=1 Tax=Chitinophaga costaii TaxID=1335309 RepID=A0A1C4BFI9_9BACT|nr:hypothetical protein GA0116948_10368 [Chitinophaga costaii]